jgi:hypothetical protein
MNVKQIGEIYEIELASELMKRNCSISIPLGDSQPYDLIVDNGVTLIKVQVKTTMTMDKGRNDYRVSTAKGSSSKKAYLKEEVDIFACKVIPTNEWYFLSNRGQKKVNLNGYTPGNFDLITDMI